MLVKRQNLYRNYLLSNHTKLDIIMFNKLQYISQGNTVEEQTRNIHQALDGGCKWIQLRFKTIQLTQLCFGRSRKILCEE
jgi:thiamine-phosphate pyrophosphorylase